MRNKEIIIDGISVYQKVQKFPMLIDNMRDFVFSGQFFHINGNGDLFVLIEDTIFLGINIDFHDADSSLLDYSQSVGKYDFLTYPLASYLEFLGNYPRGFVSGNYISSRNITQKHGEIGLYRRLSSNIYLFLPVNSNISILVNKEASGILVTSFTFSAIDVDMLLRDIAKHKQYAEFVLRSKLLLT